MSDAIISPTPYPEVNAVLNVLLLDVQEILGDQFIGMYLYGSLASGDFDQNSDVDFVVATEDEISGDLFSALQAMHVRIAMIDSWCATQLEGSYIPRQALRRYDPAHARHPHIDRGGTLVVEQHDPDWVIQRHILQKQGVVVAGPAPQTLIDPVGADELRRAVLDILNGWWAPMLQDPARLQSRGYQSYAVLTMCRVLYTLQHGNIVSKPLAARWAQAALGERWLSLIERAWVGRQNPQLKAQAEDVNATLDFIRYVLEHSQQLDFHFVDTIPS